MLTCYQIRDAKDVEDLRPQLANIYVTEVRETDIAYELYYKGEYIGSVWKGDAVLKEGSAIRE